VAGLLLPAPVPEPRLLPGVFLRLMIFGFRRGLLGYAYRS
jgi:hypothetical protein